MSVEAYLYFNGNCREAVEFYSEVFGTEKPKFMQYGDPPPNPEFPIPEEAKNLILHSTIQVAGSNIMFSDFFPGMPYHPGNNISLTVVSDCADDIKAYFNKLSENGVVTMELQETFWSKSYGQVTDKYGIQWQLSYSSEENPN